MSLGACEMWHNAHKWAKDMMKVFVYSEEVIPIYDMWLVRKSI
jgi:hypothetical protein